MDFSEESYLKSLSYELTARSNRIRYLIGDAHWASDGYHNENIVRDFLTRYSPKSVEVCHGFIRTIQLNGLPLVSPEIDILLTDTASHVPLFSEGGLQIIEPDAVRAYFEVKSTFSRQSFRSALEHIQKIQSTFPGDDARSQVWRCVFFNSPGSQKSIPKVIIEEIKKIEPELGPRDIHLPNCVVINGTSTTFITASDASTLIRYFETAEFSLACALADIMTAFRDERKSFAETDLQRMIESLNVSSPIKWII